MIAVAVMVAGALGAISRYLVDDTVSRRVPVAFPWGTSVVNLSGSLVLGVVVGLVTAHALPDGWRLVAGTGFCGGYTTFSTFAVETITLGDRPPRRRAAAYVATTTVGCLVAAGIGLSLGSLG